MSASTLERMISSYMGTDQDVYTFGWQGGEPTLMGLDFFKAVTDLQQRYGRRGVSVANGVQTNAVLVDDNMAEHFARFNFLLGCSLDGPADIHDVYRRTVSGAPSHADVRKGIDILRRHGVQVNILSLVSHANVRRARAVYDFLVESGFHYHQYIPCVEFDEAGKLRPFAINGEEWGDFLCELFDRWYPRDTRSVSIRYFDSILAKLAQNRTTICTLGEDCRQYFVVEHNGDIYPCDFFVEPRWKLGNISDVEWKDVANSPLYREFGQGKTDRNAACSSCDVAALCMGDCMKHRPGGAADSRKISVLCKGWRQFLVHSRDAFGQLTKQVLAEEKSREAMWNRAMKSI